MRLGAITIASLLSLFTLLCAQAKFMRNQTERVPIGRVLTNLQQRLVTNSQSADLFYLLARVHSMAYAQDVASLEVKTKEGTPVFGYPGSDAGIPKKVNVQTNVPAQAVAHLHLTNAIAYYQRAVKLVMKSSKQEDKWIVLPIHLGLAWCLEQDGRKQEAIEAYRDALQLAWRKEVDGEFTLEERAKLSWDQLRAGSNPFAKPKRGSLGPGVCYSEEIIGYLLALLDLKKDAKEIAQLEADRNELRSMGRAITPLIIPLHDGLGLDELVNSSARVAFDLDGSGEPRRWGWITTNAAWLVFDHDDTGRITSGLQMLGNVTFWIFWRDGYAALASLDDDGDGRLSGNELDHLALWQDRNSNGVCEPGEVTPVTEHGITALDCHGAIHPTGIPFNERGVSFRNGTTRPTYDWIAPSR